MNEPKIVKVIANSDKTLFLEYINGENRIFDVKPYIEGSWYSELNDDSYFRNIKIINGGKGIEWIHGQDIAPHELYECSKAAEQSVN